MTLKSLIADVICWPPFGRAFGWITGNSMRSDGLKIDTSCPAIGGRTKAEVFWGIYETGEMRMLRRHFLPGLSVVELGSGIGVTSSLMAKRLHPSRKLVCIEANPRLLDSIQRNTTANADGCRCEIINAAVDYSTVSRGTVRLQVGNDHLMSRVAEDADPKGHVDVPAIQLRSILGKYVDGPIQLVMDIEGAEVGLVRYDGESLDQCVQIIAELHSTEFEGKHVSVDEIRREICEKHGFEVIDRRAMVFVMRRHEGAVLMPNR